MEISEAATDALADSDTAALDVSVGEEVECMLGKLKGVRGKVVAHRAVGRILVRLGPGMYLEVPRFCVRRCRD